MASNIRMPGSNITPTTGSLHSTASISPNIGDSSSGEKSGYIIKIILIIGAILFLAYNLFLYLTEGVDIFERYFGINILGTSKSKEEKKNKEEETTEQEKAETDEKNNIKLDESQKEDQRETSSIENIIEEEGKNIPDSNESADTSKKESKNVQADISTESSIQQSKKGGYCYIGTDRSYRTCVKMKKGYKCMSDQVFPTLEVCINPKLRA